MSLRSVRGQGYSEADTKPLSDAEAVEVERRRVTVPLCDPTRRMGAPNFKQPAAPPTTRVSGMTTEEVKEWLRTGEMPCT